MLRTLTLATLTALLPLVFGCAQSTSCLVCYNRLPGATEPTLAARGELSLQVDSIGTHDDEIDAPPKPGEESYHLLSAADAQCQAARHAVIANLAMLERDLAAKDCDAHSDTKRQLAAIQSSLLTLRANQDRNRAAGDALTAYYQLMEVEHAIGRLVESNDLLQTTIDGVGNNAATFGIDIAALKRSRLEIHATLDDLRGNRRQLNEQLSYLIGRNHYEVSPIWPTERVVSNAEPIDVTLAVADGFAMRSELIAVRMMLATLDSTSVTVAAAFLSRTDQALGSAGVGGGLLFKNKDAECDVAIRRTQLVAIKIDLERRIAAEIRAAVASVEAARAALEDRQEVVANWKQRIRQLTALQGNGQITAFDVRAAQIELHRADRELVSTLIAWQLARVDLAQAQGWLAVECGYSAPGCW